MWLGSWKFRGGHAWQNEKWTCGYKKLLSVHFLDFQFGVKKLDTPIQDWIE